jgi:hypothetical protein
MALAIGVVNPDGSVILLPDNDYPLSAEHGIVVVSEDDDSYEAVEFPFQIDVGNMPERKVVRRRRSALSKIHTDARAFWGGCRCVSV